MRIARCTVNHIENPLGFDLGDPTFSWVVEGAKGQRAEASRIVVTRGGDVVADTGWAQLDSIATRVEGLGEALSPRTRYEWCVSVRSEAGEEATSDVNWFETGKMGESWEGAWLTCEEGDRHPVFSTSLALEGKPVRSARLYACGLGLYQAFIDDERVGDEYLAPGTNAYDRWLQVQTYDVTDLVAGGFTISFILGNGWYKGRFGYGGNGAYYGDSFRLIAELRVTYADGTEQVVGTGEGWRVTRSNVTFSTIYDGEQVDDTLPAAAPVAATPLDAGEAKKLDGLLCDRLSLPVTAHELFEDCELVRTPAGECVLDLGQNIAGVFRLRVCEPAGTMVRLQFGELLQDGNFYRDNLRSARAEYVYVSDGAEHVLEPRFTYYGYRYVKVEVGGEAPEGFDARDFTGIALYSDFETASGTIETGNPLVNQLVSNTRWGMRGNFVDTPTDCPQRDERMGWTGDAQVFSATALYLGRPYAFYRKYLRDMAVSQQTLGGMVPGVVPSFGLNATGAVWGDATCIIPWNMWLAEGDPAILAEHLPAMRAWVDWVEDQDGDDHGWGRAFQFGDWLALDGHKLNDRLGGTDEGFIAYVYWWRSAKIVADAARVLGDEATAATYDDKAERVADWIRTEYYSATGRCVVNTQTAYVVSLHYGFGDPEFSARELKRLLDENDGKLTCGFVGAPLLCLALSEAGMHGYAYDLLLGEGYPGWLYAVKLGATTIWERWNSLDEEGRITGTDMNSMNHYSYGSVCEWLWRWAAGLTPAEPGFRRARVAPKPGWRLGCLDARLASAAGGWRVAWKILDERHLRVEVEVPFGATAEVELPLASDVAYDELGGRVLAAGAYAVEYETTEPLRRVPSADWTLARLMGSPDTYRTLLRYVRHPEAVPAGEAAAKTVRELAARMGLDDGRLAALDADLGALAE